MPPRVFFLSLCVYLPCFRRRFLSPSMCIPSFHRCSLSLIHSRMRSLSYSLRFSYAFSLYLPSSRSLYTYHLFALSILTIFSLSPILFHDKGKQERAGLEVMRQADDVTEGNDKIYFRRKVTEIITARRE